MRSTTVARLLYNPIFQKSALPGWHVPCFSYEISPTPTPASPLSPGIRQAAAGTGGARIPQLRSQQETQRRVLEGVNQLPTESTRSHKLFLHSDTKSCTQSPSGQWPTEQFNPFRAEARADTGPSATEGLWGSRALPQKPAPHGFCLLTHTYKLQGNEQFPPRRLTAPPTLICSITNKSLLI